MIRYSVLATPEIPTFMRAPHSESWDDVDLGLVGVPFDGGVTNRTGARHGPREIRNQSSLMRRKKSVVWNLPLRSLQHCRLGRRLDSEAVSP